MFFKVINYTHEINHVDFRYIITSSNDYVAYRKSLSQIKLNNVSIHNNIIDKNNDYIDESSASNSIRDVALATVSETAMKTIKTITITIIIAIIAMRAITATTAIIAITAMRAITATKITVMTAITAITATEVISIIMLL